MVSTEHVTYLAYNKHITTPENVCRVHDKGQINGCVHNTRPNYLENVNSLSVTDLEKHKRTCHHYINDELRR